MNGPVITLRVLGRPAPQGSKSFMGRTPEGKPKMVESSKVGVDQWRGDVVRAARHAIEYGDAVGQYPLTFPLTVPLVARMVFSAERPKSHYRTGRHAHLLRDAAPLRPASKPDLSKLARSTEDALETAGLIKDDALIVDYARLAKVWCREDPEALEVPGALIVIGPYSRGRIEHEQYLPVGLVDLRSTP